MIKPLKDFTQGEIQSRITNMTRRNYATVKKFHEGDHWQAQAGWVGPLVLESDGATSADGMTEIENKFVYANVIAEIVGRHISGVLGDEPHWQVTPKQHADPEVDAEDKAIEDIETALSEWMDKRLTDFADDESKTDPITTFAVNLLCAGRAAMRIFVPVAMRDGSFAEMTVSAGTLEESLQHIYFQVPNINQCGVLTDKNTQDKLGSYYYSDVDINYLEKTWVENGVTILETTINNVVSTTRHNMRGNLFIFEARRPPLVSDSIISLQKLINMTLTMLGRNVVVGGNPETFFLNAMLPGRREIVDGQERYVADPVRTGAGAVYAVTGVPVQDASGNQSLTTPSVTFRDPVPVTTFVDTLGNLYRTLLEEAQQLHALITGDAAPSGESRIQALADFENSLVKTAACLNSVIQWLLESALSLAAGIMGNPTMFDEYRIAVQCRTETGPVSSDMLRTLADIAERNFLSHETGLSMAGVQDTEAEIKRVDAEKEKALQEQQQMLGTNVSDALNSLIKKGQNNTNGQSNQNGQPVTNGVK